MSYIEYKRDADGWSDGDSESNYPTVDDVVADVKANGNMVKVEIVVMLLIVS